MYPPAHSLHINEERCKRLTGRKLRQLVQIQLGCEPWREREREERERGGRGRVGDGTPVAVSALFDA